MDPAKVSFLFGEVPDGFDVEDPDDRAQLVALHDSHRLAAARSAMRAAVAEQVVADDPPLVWATAQRLVAGGLDRADAFTQLAMAFMHATQAALADPAPLSATDAYEEALGWLPVVAAAAFEVAMVDVVRTGGPLPVDEAERLACARLGHDEVDPLSQVVVDRVMDDLIDDDSPLALLAGDDIVHVGALTDGIVLCHRVNASERALDVLTVSFDLAGFSRRDDLRLPSGEEIEVFSAEPGHLAWHGPDGWLLAYSGDDGDDCLVAIRVDDPGVVTIEVVPDDPPLDLALVGLIREVYDVAVAEPWLPVSAEDLVLGARARDRRTFAQVSPPLYDLCDAAGLEARGGDVAHEDSVWIMERRLGQMHRVYDTLDDEGAQTAALRVLEAADDVEASQESLRQALADLHDPEVAEVVVEELDVASLAEAFAARMLAAASTARQRATARWMAAIAAERAGDTLVAEAHLQIGLEADPSSGPVVERAAWYASDRGNAAEALRLWRRLDRARSDDIRAVEPFTRRSGPKVGRNDPCWCGSGRKHKVCHPGEGPGVALADRVGWLCRKAAAYVEHAGAESRALLMDLVRCRAVGPDEDSVLDALTDPIVMDCALTEGGWFARFVRDRGRLLPDDEALLAESWLLVARTVYEVVDVDPGVGLRVRDLRSGDVLDVRERTFSQEVRTGAFVCARAVPDSQSHQFVGGLFRVAPGTEAGVLDLCDEGDPEEICEWVAALHRGPIMRTARVRTSSLPSARVVTDDRVRLATGEMPSLPGLGSSDAPLDDAAMDEIRDVIERRWISEPVPALSGLTPRQAADDPTRRADVWRLIASFRDYEDLPAGMITMRPDRLIELLGLDPDPAS